jgi:hypothetical protein
MRRALGVAVFAGMLGVTLFGIFLTPVFFYCIGRLSESRAASSPAARTTGRVLAAVFTVATLGLFPLLRHLLGALHRRQPRLSPLVDHQKAEEAPGSEKGAAP